MNDSDLRRILEAAAARPEELPKLTPHLLTRVKALARARKDEGEGHEMGAFAWRLLPALVVLAALLGGWSGYENARLARARVAAAASLEGGDVALAAVFLGGETAR